MGIDRIVSLLPSATELLYELGEQKKIFGVTHECQFPESAKEKPLVIRSVINSEKLTSKEIDEKTCMLLAEKKDIFILDEKNLLNANPDLIISQETCEVCAAYNNQVNKAIEILKKKPSVYSMNPHDFGEIIESVKELGKILQKDDKAKEIISLLEKRILRIKTMTTRGKRPKVLAIEWIEPFFTAGHWIPEMIDIAGGLNLISNVAEHSRRLDMREIIESDPDIIILMPCGFDATRTTLEYNRVLRSKKQWKELRAVREGKVFAVDANSFFSKPSIRTVTGLEILVKIIHPEVASKIDVPINSFKQIR